MMRDGERVEGRLQTLDEASERAGREREPLPPIRLWFRRQNHISELE